MFAIGICHWNSLCLPLEEFFVFAMEQFVLFCNWSSLFVLSGIPDHPPNPLVELLVSGEVIALKPTSQYVHQTRTEGQQLQEQGFRGQMTVIVRATYKVN